jgi:hypothetical protein
MVVLVSKSKIFQYTISSYALLCWILGMPRDQVKVAFLPVTVLKCISVQFEVFAITKYVHTTILLLHEEIEVHFRSFNWKRSSDLVRVGGWFWFWFEQRYIFPKNIIREKRTKLSFFLLRSKRKRKIVEKQTFRALCHCKITDFHIFANIKNISLEFIQSVSIF